MKAFFSQIFEQSPILFVHAVGDVDSINFSLQPYRCFSPLLRLFNHLLHEELLGVLAKMFHDRFKMYACADLIYIIDCSDFLNLADNSKSGKYFILSGLIMNPNDVG